jgi:hypothetical protein
MGNTPNNNFPFPESTDLVKDGAQAIEDLADAIDTTLGVYAPPATGLTLINTTSFSAVSSQSLPASTFTSTYTNYLIVGNVSQSSLQPLNGRLRKAGVDDSSSNYASFGYSGGFPALATINLTGQSSFRISTNGGVKSYFLLNVFNPNLNEKSQFDSNATYGDGGSHFNVGSFHDVVDVYDSMTFIPASGTITGTISVYGYSK